MRQAVDACMKKKTLKEWIQKGDASELEEAMKFWGRVRF